MLSLVGVYRDGWRRPVEHVELWEGLTLVGSLPAFVLAQLLAHHVDGLALTRVIRAELDKPVGQAGAINGRRGRKGVSHA